MTKILQMNLNLSVLLKICNLLQSETALAIIKIVHSALGPKRLCTSDLKHSTRWS